MSDVYLQSEPQTERVNAEGLRVSGAEGQQPPSSITGVQSANTQHNPPDQSPFSVSIDWLSFTVKGSRVADLCEVIAGRLELSKQQFLGYPLSATIIRNGGAKCRIGYGHPDRPGEVHVSMSGEFCRQTTYSGLQAVARWARSRDGKSTRFDTAFDDRSGVLTVEKAYQAVVAGQCVRRSRDFSRVNPHKETKAGPVPVGDCLYLGKRQSSTFVRIYDKALERISKGEAVEGPWCRLEVEWKEERADRMMMILEGCPEEKFAAVALSVLRSVVDFREVAREDSSWEKARAEMLGWWSVLTAGLGRCRLGVQKAAITVQKLARWFSENVSTSLAVLYGHKDFGESWVQKELLRAADRFKARHLDMFQQRVPAMGQV